MLQSFLIGITAGIAATPHCLGMCGGFPLHLAKSTGKGPVALRQILFVMGKAFTYSFLGALAGALGVVLLRNTLLAEAAPTLRVLAGVVTVIFGLMMLGLKLPSIRPLQGIADSGIVRSIFGSLLDKPSPSAAFVLGLAAGFLPCPLPMGMLAVSAASHDIGQGMLVMAGVGLGTAPGLLAVGLFGAGINRSFARVGIKAAGVVALTIGVLTIGRATGVVHAKTMHPGKKQVPSKSTTAPEPSVPCCCGSEKRK